MSQQAKNPLVTVSVVSHRDSALLHDLVNSIAQHELAARLQLILTDNLGNDLPDLDEGHWNSLTIVRNSRPQGFARNQNAAFQLASGKYFCVVNPDVLFIEDVFQSLIQNLESGQGDIGAPLVIDSDNKAQDSFRDLPSPRELFARRAMGQAHTRPIPAQQSIFHPDWLAGIFLFMKRDTFSKLGGFDDRFHLYFEDVDFCTRARLMGFLPFLDTTVRVQHDARRASHNDGRYLLWHMQSAVRFFRSDVYRRARMTQKSRT